MQRVIPQAVKNNDYQSFSDPTLQSKPINKLDINSDIFKFVSLYYFGVSLIY